MLRLPTLRSLSLWWPTAVALMLVGALLALGWLDVEHAAWLVGVPGLAWFAWQARRSLAGLPRGAARLSLTLRTVAVLLVLLALADTHRVQRNRHAAVLFVLDHSDSVPASIQPQQDDYVRQAVQTAKSGDRAGWVVFGSDASLEREVNAALPTSRSGAGGSGTSQIDGTQTNIERALDVSAAALPKSYHRRVVLLSDGNETTGLAERAAHFLGEHGIALDVLPIHYDRDHDALVRGVEAPATSRAGEPFELSVNIESSYAGTGYLTLSRNGELVGGAGQPVQVAVGRNVFRFELQHEAPGFYRYLAELSMPGDEQPQNNRGWTAVYSAGAARVWLVGASPAEQTALQAVLARARLECELIEPHHLPDNAAGYADVDGVIFANVRASSLSPQQQTALAAAVRDGGTGLLVTGGPDSFALGGYQDTPLEPILPVLLTPPPERSFARALCLVIDHSGSMSGDKLAAAKRAADGIVQLFRERDQLGVVAFDDEGTWAHPLGEVQDQARARADIAAIADGGGTNIAAGMHLASEALLAVKLRARHMIVLSDGQSDAEPCLRLAAYLRKHEITVSTIAIGPDADHKLLEDIARTGGGQFYLVNENGDLPRIFLAESEQLRQRAMMRDTPVQVIVADTSEVTRDLPGTPFIGGLVATGKRDQATTPWLSPDGDPILAHWQVGLGRVLAFTSDAGARWTAPWIGEPGNSTFWDRAVRWTTRRRGDGPFRLTTERQGDEVLVTVDAVSDDGRFLNLLPLGIVVESPDRESTVAPLTPTGPGRYEQRVRMDQAGVYQVHLSGRDPATGLAARASAAVVTHYPGEYNQALPNLALLHRLAAATGGRVLSGNASTDLPFVGAPPGEGVETPLFSWLVALALLVFFADVVVRRVHVSRADWLAARSVAWHHLRRLLRLEAREPERDAMTSALLSRREQMRAASPTTATTFQDTLLRRGPETPANVGKAVLPANSSATPEATPGAETATPPVAPTVPKAPAKASPKADTSSYASLLAAKKRQARAESKKGDADKGGA